MTPRETVEHLLETAEVCNIGLGLQSTNGELLQEQVDAIKALLEERDAEVDAARLEGYRRGIADAVLGVRCGVRSTST